MNNDLTLIALKTLRLCQTQIEAAQGRLIIAKRDRNKADRKAAEQDIFDWGKLLLAAEEQADYAIAQASKKEVVE
jgi:hypothetical protein